MDEVFPYFVGEMLKLSAKQHSGSSQKRMVRDFAILGATSAPLVSGMLSLIEKGEFAPKNSNPARWLASRVAGGLVGGALFPTIRRSISRSHRKKKS